MERVVTLKLSDQFKKKETVLMCWRGQNPDCDREQPMKDEEMTTQGRRGIRFGG